MKRKVKFPVKQTDTVDDVVCCNCGHRFNPDVYTNYDLSNNGWNFNCPECEVLIEVWASVKYTCIIAEQDVAQSREDAQ